MEVRALRAFVAVVECGGFSAAARRLRVSQSAVSQTIHGLEQQLGVQLLIRGSSGVQVTESGVLLLGEARAVIARIDQALAVMTRHTSDGEDTVLRLGIPLDLPAMLLSRPLSALSTAHPNVRVRPRHLGTDAQVEALSSCELDLGLVRSRPSSADLDAVLVACEPMGVLLSVDLADRLSGVDGIALHALAGLEWVGFPRGQCSAWYDEIAAVFRSRGLELGPSAAEDTLLTADVKLASVAAGGYFSLAPRDWSYPLVASVVWLPLAGSPLIRRTWAAWPAKSARSDIATFVAALSDGQLGEQPGINGAHSRLRQLN